MRFAAVLVLGALSALTSFGQTLTTSFRPTEAVRPPEKKVEAREIDLAESKIDFNKDAVVGEPLKLTSAGDLKLSPLEPLAGKLKVDFKTECVVLFQWQGSGKDQLATSVETKDGKTTTTFTLKKGATDDLRQHSRAFVLPSGAAWKVVK